ncbi:MAG: MerR family transcriptional regulator [Desulfovibrionaceae bacterium]
MSARKESARPGSWTVGRLARRFELSRSTLLYYDSIGLLRPSDHAPGEYRRYSEEDEARLERIMTFRRAGLPLREIARALDAPDTAVNRALENRLHALVGELRVLEEQREVVLRLLGWAGLPGDAPLDRRAWTGMLRASGLTDEEVARWHAAFEARSPEEHQRFLGLLRMPEEDIRAIRRWSRAPQEAMRIRDMSERQLELLFELFADTPRQGPGSPESTARALALLPPLPENPRILEIGCGTGGTTLDLAALPGARVTATDVHQPFLDTLSAKLIKAGAGNVEVRRADMAALPFGPGTFDLVWAESCVFIMGYENALRSWAGLLSGAGLVVLSDLSWLVPAAEAAPEARDFWAEGYPGMLLVEEHAEAALRAGYELLGSFVQPLSDWEAIHAPLRERGLGRLASEHPGDPQASALVAATVQEMDLLQRRADQYGHVFYALRRK